MATIAAESTERISYEGIVVPYPVLGRSDFSGMDKKVDEEGLGEATDALADASKKAEEAQKEAESSKEEAMAGRLRRGSLLPEGAGSEAGRPSRCAQSELSLASLLDVRSAACKSAVLLCGAPCRGSCPKMQASRTRRAPP
jgi:hypothetical protein